MSEQKFEAVIKRSDGKVSRLFIDVPFNAAQVFKGKGRIKVKGEINGFHYRSNLIPKGQGAYILMIDKEMQKNIASNSGDVIQITMASDSDVLENNHKSCKIEMMSSNMDVLTAIKTRRSIRKFTSEKINDKILNVVLDAGFCAPSATNKRPWHFIVIRNKNTMMSISQQYTHARMLPEADCCIVVCGDKAVQGMTGFLIEDCSAAIQNMLLALHGLGLGGVWCGIYSGNKSNTILSDILKLPLKIIPVGMIAIGYPSESKETVDRFEQNKVHLEQW